MTATETSAALDALQRRLPAGCLHRDPASRAEAGIDALRLRRDPECVVRPDDIAGLTAFLEVANAHGVPVTARGAGSSTTGASVPQASGWALDLRHWNGIEIDAEAGIAHVGPGALTAEIDRRAREHGWFYPPDPSSKAYSTIGGNIATNAGGLRGAKYGVTRDYVLALEGCLPTGPFVRWGLPLRKYASGLNLRDLWIGSEGTLGVVTRASLKLLPAPPARWTALAAFPDEARALEAVRALMAARLVPSILEFLDRQSVEATSRHTGAPILADHRDVAVLLIELDGEPEVVARQAEAVTAVIEADALALQATDDPSEAEALWTVRRQCSPAMYAMGDTKLNEDVVVPLGAYHDLIAMTLRVRESTGLATPTFGHAADGNFHVHVMYDHAAEGAPQKAADAVQMIMEAVVAMGGAITGEHGIGLAKSSFLHLQHTPAEIAAMRAVKAALDPNHILNPDKIFAATDVWAFPRDREAVFPWQHPAHDPAKG